jgi:hypothetical protein
MIYLINNINQIYRLLNESKKLIFSYNNEIINFFNIFPFPLYLYIFLNMCEMKKWVS